MNTYQTVCFNIEDIEKWSLYFKLKTNLSINMDTEYPLYAIAKKHNFPLCIEWYADEQKEHYTYFIKVNNYFASYDDPYAYRQIIDNIELDRVYDDLIISENDDPPSVVKLDYATLEKDLLNLKTLV
jgi:hypothetical protein